MTIISRTRTKRLRGGRTSALKNSYESPRNANRRLHEQHRASASVEDENAVEGLQSRSNYSSASPFPAVAPG